MASCGPWVCGQVGKAFPTKHSQEHSPEPQGVLTHSEEQRQHPMPRFMRLMGMDRASCSGSPSLPCWPSAPAAFLLKTPPTGSNKSTLTHSLGMAPHLKLQALLLLALSGLQPECCGLSRSGLQPECCGLALSGLQPEHCRLSLSGLQPEHWGLSLSGLKPARTLGVVPFWSPTSQNVVGCPFLVSNQPECCGLSLSGLQPEHCGLALSGLQPARMLWVVPFWSPTSQNGVG